MAKNKRVNKVEVGTGTPKFPDGRILWINSDDNSISRYIEETREWTNVGGSSGSSLPDFLKIEETTYFNGAYGSNITVNEIYSNNENQFRIGIDGPSSMDLSSPAQITFQPASVSISANNLSNGNYGYFSVNGNQISATSNAGQILFQSNENGSKLELNGYQGVFLGINHPTGGYTGIDFANNDINITSHTNDVYINASDTATLQGLNVSIYGGFSGYRGYNTVQVKSTGMGTDKGLDIFAQSTINITSADSTVNLSGNGFTFNTKEIATQEWVQQAIATAIAAL